MITIEKGNPRHPQATALLEQSHALMVSLFPSDSNHYLSIDALCVPSIQFFVAKRKDEIIGTGALANKGDYGEIKSMFVDESARGTGAASKLLDHIEQVARDQSLPVLRLETGDKLQAAHRLYARHGFTKRGCFGDYRDDPLSLFMEKPLN